MSADVIAYLVQSLAWSAVGFIAGFAIGRAMTHPPPHHGDPAAAAHAAHAAHARANMRLLGVLLIVLAIATVAQSAWYAHQQREIAECQAEYNSVFTERLTTFVRYNAEDREALKRLIVSVFENDADPAQMRAYQHWRQVVTDNQAARDANPLPKLPENTCE